MKKEWFLTLIGLLLLYSCEKQTAVAIDRPDQEVLGVWNRTDIVSSGNSESDFRYFDMVFTYTFNSDTSYTHHIDFYGFSDENPEEIMGQSETMGTFTVQGDSIFMNARQNTSWEKGFKPQPEIVKYEANEEYGSGFEIKNKTLTLYYVTYPADAAVATQMSYEKVN